MTKKELDKYLVKKNEYKAACRLIAKHIQRELVSSPVITDMPKGGPSYGIGEYIADLDELEKAAAEIYDEAQEECRKILDFLETTDDALLKLIIYYRHILGLTWAETTEELGGGISDAGLRKKYRKFLRGKG